MSNSQVSTRNPPQIVEFVSGSDPNVWGFLSLQPLHLGENTKKEINTYEVSKKVRTYRDVGLRCGYKAGDRRARLRPCGRLCPIGVLPRHLVAVVVETLIGVTVIGGFVVLIFSRVTWYNHRDTGFQVPSMNREKAWGGHTPGDAMESARDYIEGRVEAEGD
jgi:hypothetical protein